jgi:hypothetical protein
VLIKPKITEDNALMAPFGPAFLVDWRVAPVGPQDESVTAIKPLAPDVGAVELEDEDEGTAVGDDGKLVEEASRALPDDLCPCFLAEACEATAFFTPVVLVTEDVPLEP